MHLSKFVKCFSLRCRNAGLKLSYRTSSHLQGWQKPEGYNTGITIYNSATRSKVPLILQKPGIVTWYMCGPTVYADAHIGHASCYVKLDIIQSILKHIFHIDVVTLIGITDIDDKIIKKANEVGCTIKQISAKYEKEFFEDLECLNVQRPSLVARVTDFIPQIISFIAKLIEKDFAYVTTEGNVYFIVSKVKPDDTSDYQESEFQPLIDPLKRDIRDFALWKAVKAGEPYWDSPWGPGRPGWHIECSTMASYIFGEKLDIHTGGVDLIFPHHTNEKSQSEAYHGCNQWVNYWLHTGLLHIGTEDKMSKSIGNTISIKDFLNEYTAEIFRVMCLQSTYRNGILYSSQTLDLSKAVYSKFHIFLNDVEAYLRGDLICQPFDDAELHNKFLDTKKLVHNALLDDFNTSEALKLLVNLVGEANCFLKPTMENNGSGNFTILSAIASYIDRILITFGINILCKKKLPGTYILFIDTIVQIRSNIRMCMLKGSLSEAARRLHPVLFKQPYHTGEGEASKFDSHLMLKLISEIKMSIPALQASCISEVNSSCSTISLELCNHIRTIMPIVSNFLECTEKHMHSYLNSDVEVSNHNLKNKKAPVLKSCDDLREALCSEGIAIKDLKESSFWFPAESINKHKIYR